MAERVFGVPIEAKADIVIASAGGYPKDINLYQSQKTIDNAVYAMRPGGVAVILAQCPLISDPPEFFDWFRYPDIPALEAAARDNFLISGWLAIRQMEYKQQGTIILLTEEKNVDLARRAHVEPVATMDAALERAYRKCGTPTPRITVMPQGANTFPVVA
jgi:nickel-dependent lactate racemase